MAKPNASRFFFISGWSIFLLGLLLTAAASFYVYSIGEREDQQRFQAETENIIRRIKLRFERYENSLIQARAFYVSSIKITREEFKRYFQNTELIDRYPGLMGLGFAERLEPGEVSAHEAVVQRELTGYKVWPAYKRDEYFAVVLLEPLNPLNRRAVGFDMFTEPVRRRAMELARDTGQAALSGAVKLVQDNQKSRQPGFLIYVPVYSGEDPLLVEKRREQLIGFIYSPFRSHDLFNAIFKNETLLVDFQVFAINDQEEQILVYDYDHSADEVDHSDLKVKTNFDILNRPFQIHFSTLSSFRQKSVRYGPYYVAVSGLLVTLLFLQLFGMSKKHAIANEVASERLALEAQRLRENEEALSSALKMRDEFLSIASHELKTPLTALQLQLQIASRNGKDGTAGIDPAKFQKVLKMSLVQVSKLGRLVDDLLDVTRIEAGKLKFHKEDVNLSEHVRDVLERLEEHLKAAGCHLSADIQKDIHVQADAFKIEQVISNLLMNAAKYAPGTDVKVKLYGEEKYVVIEVADSGRGIPTELQPRIFDRFERAVEQKEVSGLGLGLYISQEIVKGHSGSLKVVSEEGKGATFIIELPYV